MKKLGIALLASTLIFGGCDLLGGKKEEDGGGGGGGGGGAGMDLTKMVQVYGPKAYGDKAAVGMKVTSESKAGGTTSTWTIAIVGEDGDNWLVESSQETMAYGKDSLVGMVVQKSDGKVLSAVVGKKGEAGKEIKVNNTMPGKAPAGGKTPATVDCKIALGTFKAYLSDAGGTKTWIGSEGDMMGVMLKVEAAAGGKELKEKPSMVDVDLGGTSVKCRKLVWDNGDVMMMTEHDAVKALAYGMVKNSTKQYSSGVTAVSMDAKPELKWGEEKEEEKKEEK
ncbi:MAG: hypothetical protein JKY65_20290 [Planctomycetes bacterium]|nr:hypothetical protein [Planctomycetota bacterium]